jgi:hypothetical protein
VAAVALVLLACGGASQEEKDAAVEAAYVAFAEADAAGVDFADGPCIADPLPAMPDWVVDIAHDPRTDVDDEPENQCAAYRSGNADHFVELDEQGNLIRAR